jgi:low temperature requirement protein LtrA
MPSSTVCAYSEPTEQLFWQGVSVLNIRPLVPRDPQESHRVASPLELFTDLCYVVGVAQAASAMHHQVLEGRAVHGLVFFCIAFFAIWWAWLNFAWFNSAYDNDDTVSRLLTLLQVFGSLVVAAGIPNMFDEDFRLGVAGYSIMRIGLVLLWLRAAAGHPEGRRTAQRYALGLFISQATWLAFLAVPHHLLIPVFIVLAAFDQSVPYLAERAGRTPWHAHHIAERYGLFFIIVLGETILSSTTAIQIAIHGEASRSALASVVIGGVLITFSAWWLYFARGSAEVLEESEHYEFLWGFGHYFIYSAIALLGAALALRIDFYEPNHHVSDFTSAVLVTGPVAVFLAALWVFIVRMHDASPRTSAPFALTVVAVIASTWTPRPELAAGVLCALLLAVELRLTSTRESAVGAAN